MCGYFARTAFTYHAKAERETDNALLVAHLWASRTALVLELFTD